MNPYIKVVVLLPNTENNRALLHNNADMLKHSHIESGNNQHVVLKMEEINAVYIQYRTPVKEKESNGPSKTKRNIR